MPRTESFDDGAVFVVSVNPEGDWHHSRFPQPFVTVDYDADDNVLQVVAVGTAARELAASMRDSVLQALEPASDTDPEVLRDVSLALAAA